MKKIVALAAVAVAAISLASAKGFSPVVGVHGFGGENLGTTFADKVDENTKEYLPLMENIDFGAGAFVNITLDGNFGIQPEVNFMVNNVSRKTDSKITVGNSVLLDTTTITSLSYYSLDIPVLLTYRYNKFNFAIGPYVSIPLNREYPYSTKTTNNKNGDTTTHNYTATGEAAISNAVIFGMTAGLDYEQRMGLGRLIYGARYNLDFTPVKYTTSSTDTDGNKVYTDHNMFTRRFLSVDVGYKLAL